MKRTAPLSFIALLSLALIGCGDSTTLVGPQAEAALERAQEASAEGGLAWNLPDETPPLIFLDGVAVDTADVRAILPADIDRIEVRKRCRAVAAFGDEAWGGAILIYTKEFEGEILAREVDRERYDACVEKWRR